MNKVSTFIIAIALALYCLQLRSAVDTPTRGVSAVSASENFNGKPSNAELEFIKLAKKHNIATRKVDGIREVLNGYYIVAGVFGDQSNAKKFRSRISSSSYKAQILYNNRNKMHYVYLAHHRSGVDAVNSYVSELKKDYKDIQ